MFHICFMFVSYFIRHAFLCALITQDIFRCLIFVWYLFDICLISVSYLFHISLGTLSSVHTSQDILKYCFICFIYVSYLFHICFIVVSYLCHISWGKLSSVHSSLPVELGNLRQGSNLRLHMWRRTAQIQQFILINLNLLQLHVFAKCFWRYVDEE